MERGKRCREEACAICSHYHDYEGGEPCIICGHVLVVTDKKAGDTVMPTAILPGHLYLGSYDTASRSELLKAMGITHILNTVPNCQALFKNTFQYHTVSEQPPKYEECHAFIETVRFPEERILVYCMSGSSRAPAVVISYLMKKRGWRLAESYRWVKDKRPSIKIQAEETKRLIDFELAMFGSCSAPAGLAALDQPHSATFGQVPVQQASGQFTTLSAPPTGVLPVFGGGAQWCLAAQPEQPLVFGVQQQPAAGAGQDSGMMWQ